MLRKIPSPSRLTTEVIVNLLTITTYPTYDYSEVVWKDNEQYRTQVIDWMFEVCVDQHLHTETVFIARSYFDRYVYITDWVALHHFVDLQLIGSACLFLASGLNDLQPLKSDTITDYGDGAFTHEQLLAKTMEIKSRLVNLDYTSELTVMLLCKELLKRTITPELPKPVTGLAQFFCSTALLKSSMPSQLHVGIGSLILALTLYGYHRHANFLIRKCKMDIHNIRRVTTNLQDTWKSINACGSQYYINRCWGKNGYGHMFQVIS